MIRTEHEKVLAIDALTKTAVDAVEVIVEIRRIAHEMAHSSNEETYRFSQMLTNLTEEYQLAKGAE